MIRATLESETESLLELARSTDVFKPMEIDSLKEVLEEYHAMDDKFQHRAMTYEQDDSPIGFAYYAPIDMTDRTWLIYWIFVGKATQARGVGTRLLKYAESDIARTDGRLLLIDTSSLPSYEPTRRFYLKHGYEVAGIFRDFYADGDDQVAYVKRLRPADAI
jgi:ribosomal protein S18 acetylase RimI-like enzyme